MLELSQMESSPAPLKVREAFGLTAREREVVALACSAYSNKDLAGKLGISQNTAKRHFTNIFDKLGVSNRLELLIFAIDHGLNKEG
jgi:two-component system, NarL family, nitrate/nitrite response regulator NarL